MTTSQPTNPASNTVIAALLIVAAVCYALYRQFKTERRIRASTILWALPFLASEACVAAWLAMGICDADEATVTAHAVITLLCAMVPLVKAPIQAWFERPGSIMSYAMCLMRDVLLMAVASILSVIALETACNAENIARIPSSFFLAAATIVLLIMVVLYFAGQRFGAACSIVAIICCGLGIAEHFVIEFKGAALLPSDLLAAGTAMAVSDGYDFTFSAQIVQALTYTACAIALLAFVTPPSCKTSKRALATNVLVNLVCALVAWSGVSSGFQNVKLEELLGFSYDRWWPISSYSSYGFVPVFTAIAQNFAIDVPDGYSSLQARKIEDGLDAQYDATRGTSTERSEAVAQFDQTKPTVIAVMNETFSDLSIFSELQDAGYFGPTFYNSLPDTLQRGTLLTSVHGGGTANTEFEFLTNDSLAFIGSGKYPYSLYNLGDVDSLAKQLAAAGYKTTAMHPNLPDNWNRRTAYKHLGFSKFLSIDDFEGAPRYHSGVTDAATYDKVLELLEKDDSPQFILDVTMANHGGYDYGTVPVEDMPGYYPAGASEDTVTRLNVYLACMQKADQDLQYFIDRLRQLDRPVVLVFFGDHQPTVSASLFDELHPGSDDATRQQTLFQTTYFIWANYDVSGNDQTNWNETIGANELSARMLDLIGAPLTSYQKALLATRETIPGLCSSNYLGADGMRYLMGGDSPYADTIDKIQRMQYLNFAEKL